MQRESNHIEIVSTYSLHQRSTESLDSIRPCFITVCSSEKNYFFLLFSHFYAYTLLTRVPLIGCTIPPPPPKEVERSPLLLRGSSALLEPHPFHEPGKSGTLPCTPSGCGHSTYGREKKFIFLSTVNISHGDLTFLAFLLTCRVSRASLRLYHWKPCRRIIFINSQQLSLLVCYWLTTTVSAPSTTCQSGWSWKS